MKRKIIITLLVLELVLFAFPKVALAPATFLNQNKSQNIVEVQVLELKKEYRYVFIGDSRTVGMSYAIDKDNTIFIGKVSMGYNWLVNDAMKQYEPQDNDIIIFNLGINDLGNLQKYYDYYESIMTNNMYFMSVNPVTNRWPSISNQTVENFNFKMQELFTDRYIDIYNNISFQTNDGLHYVPQTYIDIYNYTLKEIENGI